MAVKPMAESGYLKGLCFCIDPRSCWHGCCLVRRQLESGSVLLENAAGYVRLARPGEVTVSRTAAQQKDGQQAPSVSRKGGKGDRQLSQIEPKGGE